jgi:predicted Holliday junction resolvase-like endonuclease
MINSWKSFVYTVDQMRQLQKNPKSQNSTMLKGLLSKAESEVDEACNKKIAEWNSNEELFKKGETA